MNDSKNIWSEAEPFCEALNEDEVHEAFLRITDKPATRFDAESMVKRSAMAPRLRLSKKRRIAAMALAACLAMALGATAVAATQPALFEALSSWLGVSPENAQQTELFDKAGSIINKSVSKNGTTVTVGEIAGDGKLIYVSLKVSSKAIKPGDSGRYSFGSDDFQVLGSEQDSGGGFYSDAAPDEKGDLYLILGYHLSSASLLGKNACLSLRDLICNPGDSGLTDHRKVVVSGVWDFNFLLNYKDTSRKLPGGSFEVDGKTYQISDILFSAVALHYHLSGPGFGGPAGASGATVYDWREQAAGTDNPVPSIVGVNRMVPIRITFKDDSTLPSKHTSGGIDLTNGAELDWAPDNTTVDVIIPFGKIVDPDQVSRISFGDYIITVK